MPTFGSVFLAVCLILLALAAILVVIFIVNALRLKPTPINKPLPTSSARGDDGAVGRFQEMLRLPTVWGAELPNPNRTSFDEFIPTLKRLYPRVFEKLELTMVDTYGILLKWAGSNPSAQPVVLMAHHDVVEVQPEEWTHEPFGAEIADGRIWARGVLDTKCVLAALFEATDRLLAEGYQPPRDVYLCSSNNEEDMGSTAPNMVAFFKERGIEPLLVLDEGGAVIDKAPLGVAAPFAMVGVAEKGICNVTLTVASKGGHASTPSPDDAPSKLARGISTLLKNQAPARLNAPTIAMLKELAARGSFGLRLIFGNLWFFKPLVLAIMKGDAETAAMVRSTYAPTELAGGRAINVIPKEASVGVNIRISPSESGEVVVNHLRAQFGATALKNEVGAASGSAASGSAAPESAAAESAGDVQTEVTYLNEPSPISPFDDEVFGYLSRIIHSLYPSAGIAPYVQNGATDARHFARICPHTYRFSGFVFKADQRTTIHGQDENMDVESYLRGVGFYYEFVRHLALLDEV
ncbi:MAG: M20/M25/M40 family metallo-hydrolase [Coriobacteriia bacterium]|nr:M20/M25/M40 family metallo-hydrolase [Coriobacteriia bacterium]